MNLWVVISSMILTLGLTIPTTYELPAIVIDESGEETTAQVNNIEIASNIVAPHKTNEDSLGVKLGAESAAVMDRDTDVILWQKNAHEVRSIASITKLMSAIVFLENNPGWQEKVTMNVSDEVGGAAPNILRGESVVVRDLFHTSLIASDNNATMALARSTGLSKEEFVKKMNEKALELGLPNTRFVEPTGLNSNNKSTALEILQLAKHSFSIDDIQRVTAKRVHSFSSLEGKAHRVYSTNRLLDSYLDVTAGKTGYISESAYGLVSQIKGKSGQEIIVLVLGAENNEARFSESKILASWTLDNYAWY